MAVTIAIVGCLDTKGDEVRYMARAVEEEGHRAHIVDAGVLGEPPFRADTPREAVAAAAGTTLEALRARNDRGEAVAAMSAGAAAVVRALHEKGAIQGVLAAGGSAGTSIGTAAMRVLPVGFPKLMVSTLASGDVAHFVDTKDVTLMYSVVDIAGINRISARILTNAARAVVAMAAGKTPDLGAARPLVATTMFGVTTPCVTEARKVLEAAGYEVLVFHATGTGGRAMEGLIEDGYIAGVLDVTTTELADELVGGILSAGPRRLTVAGEKGVPQVVSIGAMDMVNFGPRPTVPARFAGRKLYQHNAAVTLMRTTVEENAQLGARIAQRLNGAKGPVKVLLPLRGVSLYAKAGGPFFDPEADRACVEAIRKGLRAGIDLRELDTDLNDPAFARALAEALIGMLRPGVKRA
ncbi:MAG: Tm-1-like ATP-binding domain-containing protein [Planctomycetes bacterium]|nr:Tm-1-like ATP-binding domain-containing protein [Planctomycetota bacterium]